MFNKKIISISTVLIFCISLLVCQVVLADNAGLTETDNQPVSEAPLSKEEKSKKEEMELDSQKVIKIYEKVKKGEAESSEYWAALDEFKKKWKTPKNSKIKDFASISSDVGILTIKNLGVTKVGQETTYYCGPASAYQLLNYKGITRNPYDFRSLTQSNLANDLGTTSSGTPFPGTWTGTLQNWTSGIEWAYIWSPSSSTLLSKTKLDVDANWPLIYDTYMSSSSGYLPGYSSGTIYHYVTGDGYDDVSPQEIHYVDPNQYRSAAYGPHWVSLSLMTNVLQQRGIIW